MIAFSKIDENLRGFAFATAKIKLSSAFNHLIIQINSGMNRFYYDSNRM